MLTIRGLSKRFDSLPVLDGVDLAIADGEIVALTGPSGCGKTTILNCVAGLQRPDAGVIDTEGARVGYVFQEDRLLPWLTVAENVAIVGPHANPEETARLLELVGLDGFADFLPAALSGGMRQRCALARAYNHRCDLLLMDEPFKSLDAAMRMDMLTVLMAMWRERRNAVLLVTHDLDEALAVASRIVVLGARPARVVAEHDLGETLAPRLVDERKKAEIMAGLA